MQSEAPECSLAHHAPWASAHPTPQGALGIQHTASDSLSTGYSRLQLGKPQ